VELASQLAYGDSPGDQQVVVFISSFSWSL